VLGRCRGGDLGSCRRRIVEAELYVGQLQYAAVVQPGLLHSLAIQEDAILAAQITDPVTPILPEDLRVSP